MSESLPWTDEYVDSLQNRIEELERALQGMLNVYGELHARFDLGDCDATIEARAVLEKKS